MSLGLELVWIWAKGSKRFLMAMHDLAELTKFRKSMWGFPKFSGNKYHMFAYFMTIMVF